MIRSPSSGGGGVLGAAQEFQQALVGDAAELLQELAVVAEVELYNKLVVQQNGFIPDKQSSRTVPNPHHCCLIE